MPALKGLLCFCSWRGMGCECICMGGHRGLVECLCPVCESSLCPVLRVNVGRGVHGRDLLQLREEVAGLMHILARVDATEHHLIRVSGLFSLLLPSYRAPSPPGCLATWKHICRTEAPGNSLQSIMPSLVNIPTQTSSHTSTCSNTPFQRGRWYKQAQHRLPSLAPCGAPFCTTPGKDLLPKEPSWVVQESKGTSPLPQHPFRNSRHKHTTADGGAGEGGQEAAEEPLC